MKEEKGKKQKRIQGKSRPKKKKKRRVKRKNKVLKAPQTNMFLIFCYFRVV